MKQKQVIVITGPTAVGKTEATIQLAAAQGLEIISCDSRQFYREMNIGTAKPSDAELSQAPHHFINSLSIGDSYSAGDFERDGLMVLDECFSRNNMAIVSGGSGLYIKALCSGLDVFPEVPRDLFEEISAYSLEKLQKAVGEEDPKYYQEVDVFNKHRLVRALSVIKVSGKPFSSFRSGKSSYRPFSVKYIILNRDREELYKRINHRVDQMIEAGLVEEARSLFEFKDLKSLQTVGYQEIFSFLAGNCRLEEAVELIKRNSRRYAKRQLTWFRKLEGALWMHPDEFISKIKIDEAPI